MFHEALSVKTGSGLNLACEPKSNPKGAQVKQSPRVSLQQPRTGQACSREWTGVRGKPQMDRHANLQVSLHGMWRLMSTAKDRGVGLSRNWAGAKASVKETGKKLLSQ